MVTLFLDSHNSLVDGENNLVLNMIANLYNVFPDCLFYSINSALASTSLSRVCMPVLAQIVWLCRGRASPAVLWSSSIIPAYIYAEEVFARNLLCPLSTM